MDFRKKLSRKLAKRGISQDLIPYTAQGFLELLADQLALASEQALQAAEALKAGNERQALKMALPIDKSVAEAMFHHEVAVLLLGGNKGVPTPPE